MFAVQDVDDQSPPQAGQLWMLDVWWARAFGATENACTYLLVRNSDDGSGSNWEAIHIESGTVVRLTLPLMYQRVF